MCGALLFFYPGRCFVIVPKCGRFVLCCIFDPGSGTPVYFSSFLQKPSAPLGYNGHYNMKKHSMKKLGLKKSTLQHLSIEAGQRIKGGRTVHVRCEITANTCDTCAYSDCIGGGSCASNCGITCYIP
jgi:hypothetical protein